MRLVIASALMVLASPALAQEYGGGGVQLHQAFVPYTVPGWAGGTDLPAPGLMNCVGGLGYAVHDGVRTGGMGAWCGGARARTGFGGLQGGWQSPRGGVYSAFHATVGAGWMGLDAGNDSLRSTYLFARPTVSLGVPVGSVGAVEGGLFAQLQVPVSDSLNGRPVSGSAFPHFGVEISFLLGDFSRAKRRHRLEPPQDQATFDAKPPPLGSPEQPKPATTPRPVTPPPERQPAEVQPADLETEERPLAIPEKDQPRTPPRGR